MPMTEPWRQLVCDEIEALLRAVPDVAYAELLLPDMNGILRGKRIPREEMDKLYGAGVNLPAATTMLDVKGMTFETIRQGSVDGDPDALCHAVPGSLSTIPWADRRAVQALVTMSLPDGTPYFADPRNVLRRAAAPLEAMGLTAVVATELEFYLLDDSRGTTPAPAQPRIPGTGLRQTGPHFADLEELGELEDFFADVESACRVQRLPASTAVSEFAPAQYEINLHHVDDVVLACDHAVLLKRIIRGVARRHGLAASFMAKPIPGEAGCGLHIHVSLLDGNGRNVFAADRNKKSAPPFSKALRHGVGGLAELMRESMAIFAPNANSYRRFQRGFFVPMTPSWGINHRNLALRIPLSDPENTRIEQRVAGADANPYLVMAAVLAGVHHGMENKSEPGPMVEEGGTAPEDVTLPIRWEAALDAFEAGRVLRAYLGEKYSEIFAICRRTECERFHAEITVADYDWYLR